MIKKLRGGCLMEKTGGDIQSLKWGRVWALVGAALGSNV